MIKIALVLLIVLCGADNVVAQSLAEFSMHNLRDSVVVGDTDIVARFDVSMPYHDISCYCDSKIWLSNPDFSVKDGVVFAPHRIGRAYDSMSLAMDCFCRSVGNIHPQFQNVDSAYGVSDSFPKIRPRGWYLPMGFNNSHHLFECITAPTFDNPLADTTIFMDFNAKPTNSATVQLQIFDSLTPLSQYMAVPFRRKHPLSLVFSSPNYESFDSVIFTVRMHHRDGDSTVAYTLPVSWIAPASVDEGNPSGTNFALPNPFTTHATIGFSLATAERVKLQLFDITGQTLREIDRECTTGANEIDLDTRDLPPGCYWYRLHGGEWERSGKVVKLQP